MAESYLVLASGGIDSTTAIGYLLDRGVDPKRIRMYFVNYGQHTAKREDWSVWEISKHYGIKSSGTKIVGYPTRSPLIMGGKGRDILKHSAELEKGPTNYLAYVENRNMVLASLGVAAAEAAKCSRVVMGCKADDVTKDGNAKFYALLQHSIDYACPQRIQFYHPFAAMTKTFVVSLALQLNVPLHLTISCHTQTYCGGCEACRKRDEVFDNLRIKDPLKVALEKGLVQ